MEKGYITPEEFAGRYSNKKITTESVKRYAGKIPGIIKKEDGTVIVNDDARYPIDMTGRMKNWHNNTVGKARRMILIATSENCFIDEHILKISCSLFKKSVDQLAEAGLLEKNEYVNDAMMNAGCNGYTTTMLADSIIKERAQKAIELINKIIEKSVEAVSYGFGKGIAEKIP